MIFGLVVFLTSNQTKEIHAKNIYILIVCISLLVKKRKIIKYHTNCLIKLKNKKKTKKLREKWKIRGQGILSERISTTIQLRKNNIFYQ
jgi:hypothetical protein